MLKAIILGFFSAVSLAADLYSFELGRMPSNGRPCEEIAQEMAQAFSRAANVEIYSTAILEGTKETCSVKIDYVAESMAKRVSTIVDSEQVYMQGSYRTWKDCEADRANQTQVFETQTGLKSWLSYCEQTSTRSWNAYQVHAEAVGDSQVSVMVTTGLAFSEPRVGWTVALREMTNELSLRGVTVASFVAEPIPGPRDIVLRYYGKEKRWLHVDTFAYHRQGMCDSQIEKIRTDFKKSTPSPLGVYCSKSISADEVQFIFLKEGNQLIHHLRSMQDPKVYVTVADCAAQQAATEQFYREKLGHEVVSSFCGGNEADKKVQMYIFKWDRPK